jgi:hypothetical protein
VIFDREVTALAKKAAPRSFGEWYSPVEPA